MTNAEFLAIVYRLLGLKSPGSDTRDEILEAMNEVLVEYSGSNLAHYKGWTGQDVPAPATLALTRTGANTFSYTGTPLGNLYRSYIVAGSYESHVVYIDTSTTTITVESPIPSTFAGATSATQYCVGLDLSQATMPYRINDALGTGNMLPSSCHTLQNSSGEDQLTFLAFDESTSPSTSLEWRWEAPCVMFRYPQSAAASVRLLVIRQPVLANLSSYDGTQVIDFPSQWERALALETASVKGALAANEALVVMIESQLKKVRAAMKNQQYTASQSRRAARDRYYDGPARPMRVVP